MNPASSPFITQAKNEGRVALHSVWESEKLIGVALATSATCAYLPIGHLATHHSPLTTDDLFAAESLAPNQLSLTLAEKHLKPLLADASVMKLTAEGKKEIHHFRALGWKVTPIEDVCLLSYVLSAGLHSHALEDLAQLPEAVSVLGSGRK